MAIANIVTDINKVSSIILTLNFWYFTLFSRRVVSNYSDWQPPLTQMSNWAEFPPTDQKRRLCVCSALNLSTCAYWNWKRVKSCANRSHDNRGWTLAYKENKQGDPKLLSTVYLKLFLWAGTLCNVNCFSLIQNTTKKAFVLDNRRPDICGSAKFALHT